MVLESNLHRRSQDRRRVSVRQGRVCHLRVQGQVYCRGKFDVVEKLPNRGLGVDPDKVQESAFSQLGVGESDTHSVILSRPGMSPLALTPPLMLKSKGLVSLSAN